MSGRAEDKFCYKIVRPNPLRCDYPALETTAGNAFAMHAPQILVVDDDLEIRKLLARYMRGQGFRVQVASECAEVRERIATSQIDLIVLDVMLPDGSGLDLCRDLRMARSKVPIILITALKEGVDRIIGLEIGVDDCLGKPFNPRELVGRIRAILHRGRDDRSARSETERCLFEGVVVDPFARTPSDPEDGEVELTGKAT